MLKILPIFLFFLAILQVQGYSSTHKAKQRQDGQHPSAITAPIPEQNPSSQTFKQESQQQTPYEVRVVNPASKDGWDKASVIINGLLAIVGITGIAYAARTLRSVKNQTAHMGGQLIEMKRQADLVKQQVEVAVNRERARIYVDLAPANWTFLVPGYERQLTEFNGIYTNMENDVFEVLIRNEGATKALDARFIATVTVKESDKATPMIEHSQMHYIGILPSEEVAPRKLGVDLFPGLNQEILNAIHDERATISFAGFIRYQDVLSSPTVFRETGFSYEWKGFSEWVGAIADESNGDGDYQVTHFDWADFPKDKNYQT